MSFVLADQARNTSTVAVVMPNRISRGRLILFGMSSGRRNTEKMPCACYFCGRGAFLLFSFVIKRYIVLCGKKLIYFL